MDNGTPLPFRGLFAVVFWATYLWAFLVSEWSVVRHSKTSRPADSEAPNEDSLGWMMGVTVVAQVLANRQIFCRTAGADVLAWYFSTARRQRSSTALLSYAR